MDGNEDDQIDLRRRRFLVRATTATATIGLLGTAIPFLSYMGPSIIAQVGGFPIRVVVSKLKPGEQKTVEWRGRPVWIIRRTPEDLERLKKINDRLRDPNSTVDQQPSSARNLYRSIKPEFLVLVGICTHLGCSPTYRPEPGTISPDWPGGFYCSCHGSKFDMAGRVYKAVPAPINLEVPLYVFLNDNEIIIGTDKIPTDLSKVRAVA